MVNDKAIVAFSGDPITYGHIDIIQRALRVFKHITVGVGVNPDKKYTFSLDRRLQMAKKVLEKFGERITVIAFEGLLVDFAYEQQIGTIIRGVRNSSDVDYEKVLHDVNMSQGLGIDTYVLFTDKNLSHVSSSAVKELQKHNAKNILDYVPLYVKMCLEQTISSQNILGVTGEIGAGKSYVTRKLIEISHKLDPTIHCIDMDSLGHIILEKSTEPFAYEARRRLIDSFGESIVDKEKLFQHYITFIKPKELGKILWGNQGALNTFNNIMYEPMLLEYRKQLKGKKGIILLNSALLAEANISRLCNNNILLVTAEQEVRYQRLLRRGYSEEEIKRRIDSQYSAKKKSEIIRKTINEDGCGDIIEFDNSDEKAKDDKFKELLMTIYEGFGYGNL